MKELAWVIKFVLHTNLLKLNKFCSKYETFQESRLVAAGVAKTRVRVTPRVRVRVWVRVRVRVRGKGKGGGEGKGNC